MPPPASRVSVSKPIPLEEKIKNKISFLNQPLLGNHEFQDLSEFPSKKKYYMKLSDSRKKSEGVDIELLELKKKYKDLTGKDYESESESDEEKPKPKSKKSKPKPEPESESDEEKPIKKSKKDMSPLENRQRLLLKLEKKKTDGKVSKDEYQAIKKAIILDQIKSSKEFSLIKKKVPQIVESKKALEEIKKEGKKKPSSNLKSEAILLEQKAIQEVDKFLSDELDKIQKIDGSKKQLSISEIDKVIKSYAKIKTKIDKVVDKIIKNHAKGMGVSIDIDVNSHNAKGKSKTSVKGGAVYLQDGKIKDTGSFNMKGSGFNFGNGDFGSNMRIPPKMGGPIAVYQGNLKEYDEKQSQLENELKKNNEKTLADAKKRNDDAQEEIDKQKRNQQLYANVAFTHNYLYGKGIKKRGKGGLGYHPK